MNTFRRRSTLQYSRPAPPRHSGPKFSDKDKVLLVDTHMHVGGKPEHDPGGHGELSETEHVSDNLRHPSEWRRARRAARASHIP